MKPLRMVTAVWLLFGLSSLVAAAARPNLVFIIADDCTFRDLGCYGGQAQTPNIDRLASEGMQFQRCFQAAPMCSPTRHNIYTGLYPVRSGAYPNHTFAQAGTQSVAHYLQALGYRVALSGKTHIAPREVFPFEYSGKNNNPDMAAVEKLFAEGSASAQPFCLFACSNEPHSPWNKGDASQYPPEAVTLPPYLADTPVVRENFSRYLAEITYYDQQVGQILKLLDQYQLRESTLVMVVSEQGNSFPFAKWTCYGNGLQSALIVRWPGVVAPGSSSTAMVEYSDVTPTFIEAAGGTPPAELDGRSFVGVLNGSRNHHRDFTYGMMTTRGIIHGSDSYPIRTVRGERFRLIWNLNHTATFSNACTQSDYFESMIAAAAAGDSVARELVDRYQHRPEYELYDCLADPLEMNNLADRAEYADEIQRLKGNLLEWMVAQGDRGVETELDALLHLKRFEGMTRERAYRLWKNKKPAADAE